MAELASSSADNSEGDANAELLKKLRKWFRQDSDHWSKWREGAVEDYDFVAGEQWAEKDKQALQDQLRPVIAFNRVDPLIRSVSGEQINNAQEVRYLPREMGDAKANEVLTSAAMWFRDQSDADDEESEAFWDACVCGIGWTETRLSLDEDPDEPMPLIERIDPFEMIPDMNARKRNLSDARRIFRVRADIAIDEARDQYPDADDSDLDASWAKLGPDGKAADQSEIVKYQGGSEDSREGQRDTVTIVQCQWWEYRTFYKVVDPFTGEGKDLSAEEFKDLSAKIKPLIGQLKAMPTEQLPPEMAQALMALGDSGELQSVKLRKKVYRQAFIGRKILKVKDSACPDHFTFNCITGFRDRNKGHFYGLVRSMKDPQRWANKWLSQTLHIMNSTAKGGILAEQGVAENQRQFEESFAKSDQITWVENGAVAGERIMPKPGGNFPAGFFQLMEFAISSIRDVAGINLEMLGMREAGQAASLEYQRRQAGITILATLFRSMRRYHRNQGKVLLYFIQNHLASNPEDSEKRLIRIVGEEGAQYVPLIKQADVKYDIVVDEGPSSPNQKERVWSLIGENFWQLPPPIQIQLLDYSPFPESVVQKIKDAAKKASEGPEAQMAQQMMQLEARLKQIEAAQGEANVEKTKVETAKAMQEMGQGDDGAEHQQRMVELQTETQLKREGAAQEAQLQREGAQQDAQLQREGMMLDLQKHRETMAMDAQMQREQRMQNAQDASADREQASKNAAKDRQTQMVSQFVTAAMKPKPEKKTKER